MNRNRFLRSACTIAAAITSWGCVMAHAAAPQSCTKLVLESEVTAGHEWKAPIGQDWVFRIVPVPPGQAGYSGWDLVVDHAEPAGFPDALYLATPPFGSINEREIATTFGLRAQDAIGWNPRAFRFLTDPKSFHDAQQAYGAASSADSKAMSRLLELQKTAASGEFRILDAHLVPGAADPAPFAQQWAIAASRTPHQIESASNNQGTPRGELRSMRFRLTLWLPSKWSFPPGAHPARAACGQ